MLVIAEAALLHRLTAAFSQPGSSTPAQVPPASALLSIPELQAALVSSNAGEACPALWVQLRSLQASALPSLSIGHLAAGPCAVPAAQASLWAAAHAARPSTGAAPTAAHHAAGPPQSFQAFPLGPVSAQQAAVTVSTISISRAQPSAGTSAAGVAVRAQSVAISVHPRSAAQLAAFVQQTGSGPALAPVPQYPPARLEGGPDIQACYSLSLPKSASPEISSWQHLLLILACQQAMATQSLTCTWAMLT